MVSAYYSNTCFLERNLMPDGVEHSRSVNILASLHEGKLFVVNSKRRNGLILFKRYHAEFAGPGAAVGGDYDRDCQAILPINLSLQAPECHEDRQKAYLIRRQWIRLIKQITENPAPKQRVQKILDQFEQYFHPEEVTKLPDTAFAMLVGVLPQTVAVVRSVTSDGGA
ncbi:hypothetical protein [Calothrix sp. 336/3]|uniref:hypothetical protein n=1 Tax=Calothrix sp. 336/3 TaxID=1337936 RepID=UPI001EDDF529|nr:hypothetical protein [Calothrix sp. 336/3]